MGGMRTKLQTEIRQRKAFGSLEEETYLNVLRTADALHASMEEALKQAGLTPTQYNVLRILRGAGPEGLACRETAERMITRDPDVTRLFDRLEARGLVTRTRERKDRRVIITRITRAGLQILRGLDKPVAESHRRSLGHLRARRLRLLSRLLEQARETSG